MISGRDHRVRTQDAGGIIPKKLSLHLYIGLIKSKRLINDQVLGKILLNSMFKSNKKLAFDGD